MNKKLIKLILIGIMISIGLIVSGSAQAQTWSLQQCIDYAIDNNITVKQQTLNVNYQDNVLKQSRYDLIPSLNAGLDEDFSFGRSIGLDNGYHNQNSFNSSYYISSDVTLFNGLTKQNTIKKNNIDLQIALTDLETTKDNIMLNITSAYLEILFNKELVETSKKQIEVTKLQLENNNKQVDAGKMAKGKLYETEAQLANEELDLTNYENELSLSLLNLMQIMELPVDKSFDVVIPVFDSVSLITALSDPESVYNKAVSERPEVKSKELSVQSAEKEAQIAKGLLYPTVSAGASLYNNYYHVFGEDNTSFKDQIQNNGIKQVGLSVSIPIFNGLAARTNYNNAKIGIENNKNELQKQKNNLRKEIEQVHQNAVAAMKRFYSSEKAVTSSEEAFRYIEEKFNLGIVTPLEYNEAKNKLFDAQSSFIQAKYEYIFRIKILDFYNGLPITL